jgi:hypothetical protein
VAAALSLAEPVSLRVGARHTVADAQAEALEVAQSEKEALGCAESVGGALAVGALALGAALAVMLCVRLSEAVEVAEGEPVVVPPQPSASSTTWLHQSTPVLEAQKASPGAGEAAPPMAHQ